MLKLNLTSNFNLKFLFLLYYLKIIINFIYRAKALIGSDIIARLMKKIMSEHTSKYLKHLDNL